MGVRLLIAVLLAGCATPSAHAADNPASGLGPGTHDLTWTVEGRDRTCRVHLPPGFPPDRPLPLVIALHGMGADGRMMERMTRFTELADREGFAVAYPDGLNKMWRYWEVKIRLARMAERAVDDVGFIGRLIEDMAGAGVADPARIYVTGISNGAYLSNRLACSLGDRVAAIAPVAGTILHRMIESLEPSRPVPVLYIHGTEDPVVGYDGSDRFSKREMSLSADDLVSWWIAKNRADPDGLQERVRDAVDDGTRAVKRMHAAGDGGAEVVFYRIEGGGHTWPGMPAVGERVLGRVCGDFSASEAIWRFFSGQRLPAK